MLLNGQLHGKALQEEVDGQGLFVCFPIFLSEFQIPFNNTLHNLHFLHKSFGFWGLQLVTVAAGR